MPISCGHSATDAEISMLEKEYNILLPEDYKKFIQKYNGFVVNSPDFSEIDYDGVDEGIIAFYALFGMGTKNQNHDIKHHNDNYLGELDFIENKIIIGDDPGGNYYVLINNADKKGIFYWDRTHLHVEDDIQNFEIAEHNESGNLYRITNDFSSFFEKIAETTISQEMVITHDL